MKTAFTLAMILSVGACADESASGNFLGTYKTNITLSGGNTYNDTLGVSEGETADLIMSSAQLGSMKATIIGDTSFIFDQQQIALTDPATGKLVTLTLQGQGTVNDGIFAASGMLSSSTGAVALTMNGARQ